MTGQPVYLTESLYSYEPQRCLRSSSLNSLTVPYCTVWVNPPPCGFLTIFSKRMGIF